MSLCPKGSISYRQLSTILIIVVLDGAIAGIFFLYYFWRKRKHSDYLLRLGLFANKVSTSTSDVEMGAVGASGAIVTAPSVDENAPDATHALIGGFHLSRGNQPLLDFEFSELGLSIPGGKKILCGVTGTIRHGQVTAVMGPSGAGKTTFLNTLMGKVDSSWQTEGSLRINDEECKGMSKLKRLVGYVPQEDIMYREMSVWQTLKYSADVRLPREWDDAQRTRHVQAVLEVLDLTKVRNSPIGDENTRGISGGQRKRVNIGMELAACPLALFCDEPTSGLDSSASLSVVSSMKQVARATGMTVVMVIHQPRVEIWNSLDRVLILAPGGITAYLGEQRFVKAYFQHFFHLKFKGADNPADVVMDYIAAHGSECARLWKNEGSSWYAEHSIMNAKEDSEFNDAFADSVQTSLLDARLRRRSAVIPNEELAEVFKASYRPYGYEDEAPVEAAAPPALPPWRRPLPSLPGGAPSGAPPMPPPWRSRPVSPLGDDIVELPSGGRPRGLSDLKPMDSSDSLALNGSTVSLNRSNGGLNASGDNFAARKSKRRSIFWGEAPNAHELVVRGANFLTQIWLAFIRSLKLQYYTMDSFILEMGLASLAGGVIGFSSQLHFQGVAIEPYTTLSPSPELTIVPMKALYICLAVGIAAASSGVKVFGEHMVIFWREASSGYNRISYYIAQNLAVLPRIVMGALHFSCWFQLLSVSYNPLSHMFVNVLLIFYAVYGLAAIVSMLVPRRDAPLLAVVVCLIAAVLNGYVHMLPKQLNYFSYAYWSHEAIFTGETEHYLTINQVKVAADFTHIVRGRRGLDYALMFIIGTIYRVQGLGLLLFLNRDKQR